MKQLAITPRPSENSSWFQTEVEGVLPSLRGYARRLAKGSSDAEDLIQETLERAWAARVRFQPGTSFKAWTFTILKRVFLHKYRQQLARERKLATLNPEYFVALPEGDAALLASECAVALSALPHDQRNALLMIVNDGLTYEATATALGVPLNTIKSRIYRARANILRHLERGPTPHLAKSRSHSPCRNLIGTDQP